MPVAKLLLQSGSAVLLQRSMPAVVLEVELEFFLQAALGVPAWPGMIPQGKALPALVYTLVSAGRERDLDGATGLVLWSVQFDAWAKTRLEAAQLMERLRDALDDYSGPMGAATVVNATLESEMHGLTPPINASDRPAQRKTAEYSIWFREPAPAR